MYFFWGSFVSEACFCVCKILSWIGLTYHEMGYHGCTVLCPSKLDATDNLQKVQCFPRELSSLCMCISILWHIHTVLGFLKRTFVNNMHSTQIIYPKNMAALGFVRSSSTLRGSTGHSLSLCLSATAWIFVGKHSHTNVLKEWNIKKMHKLTILIAK